MTLYSIGYEKSSQDAVLRALLDHGVKVLIDVRARPLSRRAGFSKRQLQAGAEEAGLRYVHLPALGTPPEGREANKQHDYARFWRIVEAQLATPEAELDLQRAGDLAQAAPCCLLCYEADHRICHRLRVAEELAARHGLTVEHLVPVPPA